MLKIRKNWFYVKWLGECNPKFVGDEHIKICWLTVGVIIDNEKAFHDLANLR